MIIVLTDGTIAWDHDAGDFDWTRTDALPEVLRNVFSSEPLYMDLRWAQSPSQRKRSNPQFADALHTLAATLLGTPKDELYNDDARKLRHQRIIFAAVFGTLLLLLLIATYLAVRLSNVDKPSSGVQCPASEVAANYSSAGGEPFKIAPQITELCAGDRHARSPPRYNSATLAQ